VSFSLDLNKYAILEFHTIIVYDTTTEVFQSFLVKRISRFQCSQQKTYSNSQFYPDGQVCYPDQLTRIHGIVWISGN